jgi:hypothetical protein
MIRLASTRIKTNELLMFFKEGMAFVLVPSLVAEDDEKRKVINTLIGQYQRSIPMDKFGGAIFSLPEKNYENTLLEIGEELGLICRTIDQTICSNVLR